MTFAPSVNSNAFVSMDPACGSYHDRRVACPWSMIASVTIDEIKHQGTIVDRRIQLLLVCSCRHELSIPLSVAAPKVGEPARCRGRHQS